MNFEIRKTTLQDVEAYSKHSIFCLTEKGIGGIFVHPFPSNHKSDLNEFIDNIKSKWNKKPFSPNWEIAWVAISENKIVGHLNMRCGGLEALVHRMKLGMGIESGYRSSGIGTALMKAAIEWSQEQPHIAWIDLSVFSENTAARKLYKKFGFKETHIIEDALRIEDKIIDDVQMTLRLR